MRLLKEIGFIIFCTTGYNLRGGLCEFPVLNSVEGMGQGPKKWTQINQGQWGGGAFGVHFGVLDSFRDLKRARKPKVLHIYISEAHSGPYFDLP